MNEFTKTIVNGLQTYIKKARSNWNQNDETAIDYIKNRTHWTEEKYVDIIPETTISNPVVTTEDYNLFDLTSEYIKKLPEFTSNTEYTVTWNGTEYKSVAKMVAEAGGIVCLGNVKKILGTGDTGEPFLIMPDTLNQLDTSEDVLCQVGAFDGSTSFTFKVSGLTTVVHKIDKKYLPEISSIKNIKDGSAEGSVRTIGTNIEISENAFAEGENTFASGRASHAEGRNTIASGAYSHAEGYNYEFLDAVKVVSVDDTTYTLSGWSSGIRIGRHFYDSSNGIYAKIIDFSQSNSTVTLDKTIESSRGWIYIVYGAASGDYSHAEGEDTFASGKASHAEGYITIADGMYSHAEGTDTIASGISSHAEGRDTIASGKASHAEGRDTIASSDYQHVQGKYNVEDTANKYAHIVGNGTDDNTKSNAHTLDWNGNAWFAGTIKVGGTGQDDSNSDRVVTEKELETKTTLPKDYFALTDTDNGYTYIVQMKNGNLVTRHSVSSIEITAMPNKTEYYSGEYFDPTGMVVTATCQDGSVIEITNYTCSDNRFIIGENTVAISYLEAGITHTTTIIVNAVEFDASTILIDFNYTTNDDGTYTITGWKQTLNGVPSTEMVIPDCRLIRL